MINTNDVVRFSLYAGRLASSGSTKTNYHDKRYLGNQHSLRQNFSGFRQNSYKGTLQEKLENASL